MDIFQVMLRSLAKLVIGFLAVVLVPTVATFGYWSWDEYRFTRRSPLAANLPEEFTVASAEFRMRVLERFPLGSPESELVSSLSEQGFTKKNVYGDAVWVDRGFQLNKSGSALHVLTLTPGPGMSFPCRLVWNVTWRANDAGKLAEIYAEHHGICV